MNGAAVEAWWTTLGGTALVGTARRPVPATPLPVEDRPDAAAEVTLLDHVAVGAALRRAGSVAKRVPPGERSEPAAADALPLAPARARQLLELLLTQSPVGTRLAPRALALWLDEATRAGCRVHHATLVPLLQLATTARELRSAVVPVLDSRGQWLAAVNPAWGWVAEVGGSADAEVDADEWPRLPTDRRAAQLRGLRAVEPGRGRALLESTWSSDPAPARVELLRVLGVGLSDDDEPFLGQALDDRAGSVREVAWLLLDRLPESGRARRLGELLEPLVSVSGMVRKKAHVDLPAAPDAAAIRDGLGKAPKGRSQRGLWLQRLASGAPFDVWTRATGLEPETIVRTLDDADALAGLRSAAVGRHDVTWSRALLERGWDPLLARWLPADEQADRMLTRLAQVKTVSDLTATARIAPGPWSAEVSAKVVTRLGRIERPRHHLVELVDVLAGRLHPSVAPQVQRLAATDDGTVTPLQQLSQYLALVPTITEAFR